MSHLGDFLRNQRIGQALSLSELAQQVGYRNLNKGVRRITWLEHSGKGKADLLVSVAEALNLDWTVVERLMEQDERERLREWEQWANEPVPMHMVVRLMAAVYARKSLPADIRTPEQAETWACDFARRHRWRVCLVVSRRSSVWIDGSGQVQARTEARSDQPSVPVGGLRFLLEG